MSKFIGKGATVNKGVHSGINTNGKPCVVESWDPSLRKYKVDFGNGFCGWYLRKELTFDT